MNKTQPSRSNFMLPLCTLIVGCGYLGERVGKLLVAQKRLVYGTTRSSDRADELRRLGIMPVIFDVTRPKLPTNLPVFDRILYCVGFDRHVGQSLRQVYVSGLQNALDTLATLGVSCPIVYASSTGVYSGDDGGWVDETSPADPQTESGQACLEAEQVIQTRVAGSIIIRYAGLYGPNRIMRRESLIRGEPVVGNPVKFLNFIQIDDAAAVAVAALEAARVDFNELYLASDGNPVFRSQFYGIVAKLLHAPPPYFKPPESGSPAALREASNKRVSNRKLLNRWGSILQYPDIRLGLAASLTDV